MAHGQHAAGATYLSRQRPCRADPCKDDGAEDDGKVGGRGRKRSDADDEHLLDERAARLAERAADDVDCRLALGLLLLVQGDVRHLLARVEEGVLGGLGHDVLRAADKDGKHERGGAARREEGRERVSGQAEREEGHSRDKESHGCDQGGGAPTPLSEDEAAEEHHEECDNTGGGREGAHEGRIVRRVGEGLLQPALPGHFDEVDGHTVCDDERGEVANVL